VVAAVQAAARSAYIDAYTGYAERERAAEDLLNLAFGDEPWAQAVAFFVSASEAGDLGLVLAQHITDRDVIVTRTRKYHGSSGLTRTVSPAALGDGRLVSIDEPASDIYPSDTRRLPIPSCRRSAPDPRHDCASVCLRDAPDLLRSAAAVVTEASPYGGFPSVGYQDVLAGIARTAGAIWMADETVTGFGRTGRWFAFQAGNSRPQLVQLGKGLTGGAAPGGALILSDDVIDSIGDRHWRTAGTYRGHPVSVAAISAVLRVLDRENLIERSRRLGSVLGRRLSELARRHACVACVEGEGLMWAIALVDSDARAWQAAGATGSGGRTNSLAVLAREAALDRGVRVGLDLDGSLWLVPPLITTEDEIERICDALDSALASADHTFERQQRREKA
jgi:4-aminobutyrate aminotransferase-like enzyme